MRLARFRHVDSKSILVRVDCRQLETVRVQMLLQEPGLERGQRRYLLLGQLLLLWVQDFGQHLIGLDLGVSLRPVEPLALPAPVGTARAYIQLQREALALPIGWSFCRKRLSLMGYFSKGSYAPRHLYSAHGRTSVRAQTSEGHTGVNKDVLALDRSGRERKQGEARSLPGAVPAEALGGAGCGGQDGASQREVGRFGGHLAGETTND